MIGSDDGKHHGSSLYGAASHSLKLLWQGNDISHQECAILLDCVLVVSLAVQILACLNAEFNVEQGEAGNFWEPLHYLLYGTGVQNFEWSEEYAIRSPIFLLPLVAIGKLAKLLPLSKLQVFFVIRYSLATAGCFSLRKLAQSASRHVGYSASVLGLLVAVFNQCIALYLGRLGIDTFTAILHCLVVAAWMEKRFIPLIWLCVITVFLRVNFIVIAAIVGLHAILWGKSPSETFQQWVSKLFTHGLLALASVGFVVFVTDSLWYGKATLSTWNFIAFNMIDDGSSNFGRMPLWFYVDKLLLDNNLVVTLGCLLSLVSVKSCRVFLVPSIALLVVLGIIAHKEYRFLFCLMPIMALYSGVFLDRLRALKFEGPKSKTNAKLSGKENAQRESRWLGRSASFCVCIIMALHILSGLSIVSLQAFIYAPHARFLRQVALEIGSVGNEAQGGCLCTFPWCSWLLPEACGRRVSYVVCMYEDFFAGYSNVTYKRFEARHLSALVDIAPSPAGLHYVEWFNGVKSDYVSYEVQRLQRLKAGGIAWARHGDRLGELGVGHVLFLEISSSPHSSFIKAYRNATGAAPARSVTHHLYHELMLMPAMEAAGMERVVWAQGVAEPGVFNVEPVHRLLFTWPALAPAPSPHYLIHSYWTRPTPHTRRHIKS